MFWTSRTLCLILVKNRAHKQTCCEILGGICFHVPVKSGPVRLEYAPVGDGPSNLVGAQQSVARATPRAAQLYCSKWSSYPQPQSRMGCRRTVTSLRPTRPSREPPSFGPPHRKGTGRVDEISYDPIDRIPIVKNNWESPPLITFISVTEGSVLGHYLYPASQDGRATGLGSPDWTALSNQPSRLLRNILVLLE